MSPAAGVIRPVAWLLAGVMLPGAMLPAGAAPPSPAGDSARVHLEVREELLSYPVPGSDLEALRAALGDQALAERAGGSHGRTHSRIRIEYAPETVADGCRARDASVRMDITTTLPEWRPTGRVDPGLAERWHEVASALQRHEARHRMHAMEAARQLQSLIGGVGTRPDCDDLRRAIDRAFMRVTLRAEFRDARYDERTRNGLGEGIAL